MSPLIMLHAEHGLLQVFLARYVGVPGLPKRPVSLPQSRVNHVTDFVVESPLAEPPEILFRPLRILERFPGISPLFGILFGLRDGLVVSNCKKDDFFSVRRECKSPQTAIEFHVFMLGNRPQGIERYFSIPKPFDFLLDDLVRKTTPELVYEFMEIEGIVSGLHARYWDFGKINGVILAKSLRPVRDLLWGYNRKSFEFFSTLFRVSGLSSAWGSFGSALR